MIEKNNWERLVEFEILPAIAIILLMVSYSDIYSQVVYDIELDSVRRFFAHGSFSAAQPQTPLKTPVLTLEGL